MEPGVKVVLTGTIKDFARIDNVYTSLKREGGKLLDNWKIDIEVTFSEQKSGVEEL
ncbi:hypothetical protein ES708_31030 [subsurface metagenome]